MSDLFLRSWCFPQSEVMVVSCPHRYPQVGIVRHAVFTRLNLMFIHIVHMTYDYDFSYTYLLRNSTYFVRWGYVEHRSFRTNHVLEHKPTFLNSVASKHP